MRAAFAWAALACALLGCGSELPSRYVIERDLGGYRYRRYQKTLGAEFEVDGNPAQGHTATYLRRGGSEVSVATAFVSVYTRAQSLSAEVREQLDALDRYRMSVQAVAGGHAFVLESEPDERWAVWVSGRHVVKLGAPKGETFPEDLADAYMTQYPSDLDEHGRAQLDASSRGPSARDRAQATEQEREAPRHLRENAPR